MTQKIGAAAKAAASPDVEIAPSTGLRSAQHRRLFRRGCLGSRALSKIGKAADADAFVIAVSTTPVLRRARAIDALVVGTAKQRFTGEPDSREIQRRHDALALYCADRAQSRQNMACRPLRRVRAADVAVLALEEPGFTRANHRKRDRRALAWTAPRRSCWLRGDDGSCARTRAAGIVPVLDGVAAR